MFASSPTSNSHFGTRPPHSIRSVPLRTRRRRKPFAVINLHTLQERPPISALESIVSTLFEKQRGGIPPKAKLRRNPSFLHRCSSLGNPNSPPNRSRQDT